MRAYVLFLRTHYKAAGFGLLMTFFSSFGQTFLISLYVPFILRELGITNAAFGSFYAVATVSSALLLIRYGRLIDHAPLRPFTYRTLFLLSISSVALGLAFHPLLLLPALLGLRFSGQGLMGHISQTVMSRYFDRSRGKALSVASLGYSIGEMLLPLPVTALIQVLGWRMTLGVTGIVIPVVLIPLLLGLPLETYGPSCFAHGAERTQDRPPVDATSRTAPSLRELLRNRFFLVLAPMVFLGSFIGTGVFFFQLLLVETRGWQPEWYALAFSGYATARFITSFLAGPVVDRLSARLLYPLHLLPMLLSLFLLGARSEQWAALVFLVLTGISFGSSSVITSALIAEVFGIDSIGAVRSMFSAVGIFGTALGPMVYGWVLDAGVSFGALFIAAATVGCLGALSSFRLWGMNPRR